MVQPSDLAKQKKQLTESATKMNQLIVKQKDILRQEIVALDKQIATLQTQKTRANADLSRLNSTTPASAV